MTMLHSSDNSKQIHLSQEKSENDNCRPSMTRRRLDSASFTSLRTSDISISVDDLNSAQETGGNIEGERLPGFTLSNRDRQNGFRGLNHFNSTDTDEGYCWGANRPSLAKEWGRRNSIDEVDEFDSSDEEEPSRNEEARDSYRQIQILFERSWQFPDRTQKKVRFNLMEDVHVIERVEPEDCPSLFYSVHELQKMMEAYKLEEQNARLYKLRIED